MKRPLFLIPLCLAFSGCGGESNEVTGKVTRRGKALADGYITFFPAGGDGNTFGAKVTNGVFAIKEMPAGKWRALVTNPPAVAEEKGKPRLLPHEPIPATATGNNRVIDVPPGKHALNVELW